MSTTPGRLSSFRIGIWFFITKMSKGLQGLMSVSTTGMERILRAVVELMDEDRVVELFPKECTKVQMECWTSVIFTSVSQMSLQI